MTESKDGHWYLGALNDGLFIVNKEPRPSTDDAWHDRPDGPTLAICISGLDAARAQQIVTAHNMTLSTITHPEAQGNKDLGEPAASGLEEENRRLREALTKLDTLMDFSEPFRPGHNVSMFEDVDAINAAMAEASELLQAQRVAQAAPTSPQPINGESELESASNGMGLR